MNTYEWLTSISRHRGADILVCPVNKASRADRNVCPPKQLVAGFLRAVREVWASEILCFAQNDYFLSERLFLSE